MRLIVCLDNRDGISFNGRRQSRDSAVCEDILKTCDGSRLYIEPYSCNIFPDTENITVCDNPFSEAGEEGTVFFEKSVPDEYADRIEEIIIYRWDKNYPSDLKFNIDCTQGFDYTSYDSFAGSSHGKIEKEVYVRVGRS